MDSTRSMVFTKIQSLEPEYASKIMGFILIQDPSDTEMFRLAFGPESLLQSIISQAKSYLGISSNICSASSSLPTSITSSSSNPHSVSLSSSSSLSYAAAVLGNGLHNGGGAGGGYGGGSTSNVETETGGLLDSGLEPSMTDSDINNNSNISNPNLFHHRRSVSLNDASYGGVGGGGFEGGGGFCRNGGACGVKHGGFGDTSGDISVIIGSPTSKMDAFEQNQEIFRSRAAAAASLIGGGLYPFSPRSNAPLPMMGGVEFNKFTRSRSERSNFSGMGFDLMDPNARQIYLTFPADSTFVEDDVSNYFSMYGPVQDVRIPYQQKRMFGFVTFVYPETVKLILADGNPHFVCDSRVLVKPYKEKGKVEKKHYQHHQLDSSPREPFEIPIGPRMYYNTQELMLRRKLENQADLQQALDLQSRRMSNLQLEGIKNQHYQQNLGAFDPISMPMRNHMNQNLIPSEQTTINHEISQDNNHTSPEQPTNNPNGKEEENSDSSEFDTNERLEQIFLPDSLFS